MALRRRSLPGGWYPEEAESIRALAASWTRVPGPPAASARDRAGPALAAVAPHAGWIFSGRIAALAVSSLAPLPKGATVAIFGGHLPPGARPLAARESSYETPLGPLVADLELLSALESQLGSAASPGASSRPSALHPLGVDDEVDNTVEVLLPLVAALLPDSRVLWLRSPNDSAALELGQALQAAGRALGRGLACLGSTDLTHYGPNYGFSPKGRGPAAEAWVREENDRRFLDALLALDGSEALRLAESERSACSAGAAAAALAFARAAGASRAELFGYGSSLEVRRDASFVGYAALGFFTR
jgi:hypothetical protein